jgi:hypothetical protein
MAAFFVIKMAKNEIIIQGTPSEQKTFSEVNTHYLLAREDLEQRIYRKNGFNDADKMFASHIDEGSWPYRSLMFDPRPYTVILEKSARLIGSKPKGRLAPREGGDSLGAYINNELLDYQWEDNTRLGISMIAKWIMMDQNVRKYGSSFALADWHYENMIVKDEKGKAKKEVFYDGPDFKVLNNRDVLANPSYEYINKWFCYREYLTIQDMQSVNDAARTDPVYRNLDLLRESVRLGGKGHGDTRNLTSQNKSMKGLQDFTGRDESNKTIEIIHERRPDRWISIASKHGVVVRDIPNPYRDRSLHVVHLKYYPLPDDLYGVNELEPVAKQIRALNAHLSAYSDTIALALRPPTHINPINVRMHTLDWAPEAKWLMNNPNVDVQQMKIDTSVTANFQSIYQVLVGSLMNAWGEQSQQMSATNPNEAAGKVTATEIRDTAYTRNVRDNMNKVFLAEALKQQIMLWHTMNQQFMFTAKTDQLKIIRIVGRDAMEFFSRQGLADIRPTDEDVMMQGQAMMTGQEPPTIPPGPRFAVPVGEDEMGVPMEVPKYMPDESGGGGNLIIEPADLAGNYDYIPDIESMSAPSTQDIEQKLMTLLTTMTNPAIVQGLAAEGVRPKYKELLTRAIEATNVVKDADSYFEDISNQMGGVNGQINGQSPINQGGSPTPGGGAAPQGNVPNGGMAQGGVSNVSSSNPVSGGGSAQVPAGL